MKKVLLELLGAILVLIVGYLSFGTTFKTISEKELSLSFLGNLFYGSKHIETSASSMNIDVLDYEIEEDFIKVYFHNYDLVLPYQGICTKNGGTSLIVEISGTKIEIYNLSKTYLKIYETFYPNMILAEIDEYVVFKLEDPLFLISKFNITNEKV